MTLRVPAEQIDELYRSGTFDAAWYLGNYPDVAALGMDPAEHYLWLGKRLGRKPAPIGGGVVVASPETSDSEPAIASTALTPKQASTSVQRDPSIDPHEYEVVSAAMRGGFYEITYPDVVAAGVDPVSHYILTGWREGRDPSVHFSTRYYLDQNEDIQKAGINPFYHWLVAGKAEGREARHQLGFRYDILSQLKPVREQIAEMKSHRSKLPLSAPHVLATAMASKLEGSRPFAVSFSHDDFSRHVGGVQLLIRREMQLLAQQGVGHLHFFPAHPLPYLDTSGHDITLGVVLDGAFLGYFSSISVIEAIAALDVPPGQARLVLHNLLGHNIDQVLAIISEFQISEGCFWLHDFSAIYNNYKLLRNDVQFSGVPKRGTMAFELCEFARADFSHDIEFGKLFKAVKLHLLSPSQTALDIWNEADIHPLASASVVEHCKLEPLNLVMGASSASGPLRIAFLGYPVAHKGGPVFEELALQFGDDPRYQFYHLGQNPRGGLPIAFRNVIASQNQPDAMRQAVLEAEIDVAIIWSIWPETFCLTAYEALAGGAALVTNTDAGNVPALVQGGKPGIVFKSEKELHAAFEEGLLMDMARRRRGATLSDLVYSDLSAPLLVKGFA